MAHKKYIIMNTKGGSGKTTIGMHVLPSIFPDKDITYYSIDSTNKLPAGIEDLGFKHIFSTVEELHSALSYDKNEGSNIDGKSFLDDFVYSFDDGKVSIVDVGGGTDVEKVFEALSLDRVFKDIEEDDFAFIIPIFDTLRDIENGYDTYMEIIKRTEENKQTPRIVFVLNRSGDPFDIKGNKEMFISFFGDEDTNFDGIEARLQAGGFNDVEYAYVPQTNLFDIAERGYKTSTMMTYKRARDTNMDVTRQEKLEERKNGTFDMREQDRRSLRRYLILVDEMLVPLKEVLLKGDTVKTKKGEAEVKSA